MAVGSTDEWGRLHQEELSGGNMDGGEKAIGSGHDRSDG